MCEKSWYWPKFKTMTMIFKPNLTHSFFIRIILFKLRLICSYFFSITVLNCFLFMLDFLDCLDEKVEKKLKRKICETLYMAIYSLHEIRYLIMFFPPPFLFLYHFNNYFTSMIGANLSWLFWFWSKIGLMFL